MPDTKRGRERQGRKKREQLETHLAKREIETLDDDTSPEYPPEETESDLLSAPPQGEE
ncbi:hypothetical protein Hbl1158_04630 [Halobaculum sp. CBA1158]|uniref:hypothetical protein n=1 Tax=Halobaculum sp. CBA1158 TaxID=2904243 RepID=UPI001F319764|nr:hypothetical protein [Halobaculum sp. CBA1158]UIP00651.1 hypothetical protein Hbl1158_04630 [Halobaculum sp. CBA1158]